MRMTLTLTGGRYPATSPVFVDSKLIADRSSPLNPCTGFSTGNQQSAGTLKLSVKENLVNRRHGMAHSGILLVSVLTFGQGIVSLPVRAEDKPDDQQEDDKGVIGALTSLFDPNEKTKLGKVLPKAYLKSAREVVKTLRESLKEDPKDMAKFRRTADAAKESIRDYLNNWRGQQTIAKEESYVELEKAIRSLAKFYSKAGPSATLPEEVKADILGDLDVAEEFL